MVFPLWVHGLSERRWPYLTIAIIVINCFVFMYTHRQIEAESHNLAQVEFPMLLIAAAHPEVEVPKEVKPLVDSFAQENKELWKQIRSGTAPPLNPWDRDMRGWGPIQSRREMTRLSEELKKVQQDSLLQKYAFYPYHPTYASLLTANFLHGGWLHLSFNMWFLRLAGTMMEDVWGPLVYGAFYLLGGVAALFAHASTYPHSITPVLGASGAIAALIGAFLVRFPEARIDLVAIYFRIMRFAWPAYLVLPLWLIVQVFWGSLLRTSGGVAYWAHIGGFLFGAIVAIAIRHLGIERAISDPVEQEVLS